MTRQLEQCLLFSDHASYSALLQHTLSYHHNAQLQVVNNVHQLLLVAPKTRWDMVIIAQWRTDLSLLAVVQNLLMETPAPLVVFAEKGDASSAGAATLAGADAYVVNGLNQHRIGPILAAAAERFHSAQLLKRELGRIHGSLRQHTPLGHINESFV